MKKIFVIVTTVIVISFVIFLFNSQFSKALLNLQGEVFPCSQPIKYSLGSFDKRFNMSKKEFLSIIDTAEKTWEKSIGKQLFIYVPNNNNNNSLKINLIYDIRQEASQKLKDIGITVNNNQASFNSLKLRYDIMKENYKKLKVELKPQVVLLQNRQNAYKKEVAFFNTNGGAPENDYNRLNREKKSLDIELIKIKKLQTEFNSNVNNINAMVIVLNRLISSLKIEVKKFNTVGALLGREFKEGTYRENTTGGEINIYQFDNKKKLARILTHEFGHALKLKHLENPKAVMYRLNNGVNQKLTIEDMLALKKHCNLLSW